MFKLKLTSQFKKDVKNEKKRSAKNTDLLIAFLEKLESNGVAATETKYKPHKLSGEYNNSWEAHMKARLANYLV
jgi:mRNA interferase YafQ